MDWPGFDPVVWQSLVVESEHQRRSQMPRIYASDRDAGAVQMAQANAQRAGVAGEIEFSCRAVSAVEPAGVGWVVTNPPYGLRVSAHKDLRNLYAQFGKVLRLKCPGWQVAILCSDQKLLHQTGLRLDTVLSFVNGGVKVKVGRGSVGD
jgi:putative N6-adenine-specific DNA methylase